MKKIKVLFTIPNFDTAGSGKALFNVATRLDSKKFEPHIACMHNKGDFFKTVEQSGIPIHILQYTCTMKPYFKGISNCYKISKQFKAIKPDIIHSFHYAADYSEALASKMAGIKWVYTKKNMNWGGTSKNAWKVRSYLATAIAIQNTDMEKLFFPNSNKTRLIPRGVNTKEFTPKYRDVNLAKQWQIKPNQRIIMCIANLVPIKGIDVLLKAFNKTTKSQSDWRLMIVGDNNNAYGEEMEKLMHQLKLKDQVIFCGKQSQMENYLSLAEIVVLPTLNKGRKEGSPVSLLEAMSAGKNVLGSNIPGIKDQLKDFPQSLIKAGCVDSWSHALSLCMNRTKEDNKELGMQFRLHVKENYTIEREVKRTEQMFLKILK
ncbi:glycosyltransferase family 4 protein [Hanstruepera marina]|uniref:glycosyltransferase family 4 protein n=1 Tax=Hanstruepera marina TaxID=2873265 RepID=UPI001CA69ADB|nr:glycosyltransferase family 4 protein [Hanstruepera marina]